MGKGRRQKYGATNVVKKAISPMNVAPHPRHPEQQIDPNPMIQRKEKERETKEMGKVRKADLSPRIQPKEKERETKVKEKIRNAGFVGKTITKRPIAGTKPQYVKDITRKTVVHQTVRSTTLQFAHSGQQAPAKMQLACSFTEKATRLSPSPLLPHLTKRQDQTHQHPQNIRKPRKRNTKLKKRLKKQQRRSQQQIKKSAKLLKHERKQQPQL